MRRVIDVERYYIFRGFNPHDDNWRLSPQTMNFRSDAFVYRRNVVLDVGLVDQSTARQNSKSRETLRILYEQRCDADLTISARKLPNSEQQPLLKLHRLILMARCPTLLTVAKSTISSSTTSSTTTSIDDETKLQLMTKLNESIVGAPLVLE